MKSYEKELKINIVLALLVIIVSIPLWFRSNARNNLSLAVLYSDLDIYYINGNYSYSKNNNVIYKTSDITYRNQNSKSKEYKMLLQIEKDDSLDYSDIYISIDNNEKIALSELEYVVKDDYYLFTIYSDTIDEYTTLNKTMTLSYTNSSYSFLLIDYLIV